MTDFVEVFSHIHGRLPGSSDIPATAKWLSIKAGIPLREVHQRLATLRAKGWVRTYKGRTGNDYAGLVVEPASRALLEAVHALVQALPGRSWAAEFHAERPVFMDTLHHVGSIAKAARMTGIPTSTAYDTVRAMHEEAALVRDGDVYRLNDRLTPLHPAIHEAARVAVIQRISSGRQGSPTSDILWHQGSEALITSESELTELRPGGLDAFANHGLPFATRRRTYFETKRRLDAADGILQAILADPSSAQTKSYAALLYEKEHPGSLDERAAWYGLPDIPQRLRDYVDEGKEVDGFLPQREYERLKALYGVSA